MATASTKNTTYFLVFAAAVYVFAAMSACSNATDTQPSAVSSIQQSELPVAKTVSK